MGKFSRGLLLLPMLGGAGCVSSGDTVPATACPEPPTADSEYVIGAGDRLEVVVWRNEELSASIPVRPDGRISTPLIDDMQASGKTPTQLADDMEAVLAEYLRTPEVSIIITGQGSANQVQVIGEVANPASLSYRYGLNVLDVIVTVGGLTEFAAGNRTDLVRTLNVKQVRCRIQVDDLLEGDVSQNINVYPGDILVVPETRF